VDAQLGSRRAAAVATLATVATLGSGAAQAQTIAPAPAFNGLWRTGLANGKRGDGIWMFSLDGTSAATKAEERTAPSRT
jgi:hypothetical protein